MKIVTLALEKGGVLKTTTTVNLAYSLANKGYKVGIIDFDNQRHASLNLNPTGGLDLATILTNKSLTISDMSKTSNPNLFIIKNNRNVGLQLFNQFPVQEQPYLLDDILKDFNELDYMFIDTPPNIELQTINALIASDYVLSPCTLDSFAITGLDNLLNEVKKTIRYNPRLKFLGVVPTKFNRKFSDNINQLKNLEFVTGSQDLVFNSRIRQNVDIPKNQSNALTVYESKDTKGIEDFDSLANELLDKINK